MRTRALTSLSALALEIRSRRVCMLSLIGDPSRPTGAGSSRMLPLSVISATSGVFGASGFLVSSAARSVAVASRAVASATGAARTCGRFKVGLREWIAVRADGAAAPVHLDEEDGRQGDSRTIVVPGVSLATGRSGGQLSPPRRPKPIGFVSSGSRDPVRAPSEPERPGYERIRAAPLTLQAGEAAPAGRSRPTRCAPDCSAWRNDTRPSRAGCSPRPPFSPGQVDARICQETTTQAVADPGIV